MTYIPFNRPFIAGKELDYITQAVIENGHLSGNGPFTQRCQSWLEENLGCRKALLTNSCTAALEMSSILCGIQQGDEVILPSFTFVTTANAFVLRGATPVFIDIRPDTLNIDESLIEDAITDHTKAIVPVHYAGAPCAMTDILDISKRHNLYVIEDAAQGLLSTHEGRSLGTLGHLGCISFHETKNIISGEGGVLLINDEQLIDRAEIIWEKGTDRSKFFRGEVDRYTWVDVGSSFLPSELVAAFLCAQFEHAENIIKKRCMLFDMYHKLLKPLQEAELITIPSLQAHCSGNGHIFYIITRSFDERKQLIRYLDECDIKTVFHYIPLHSSPAGLKYGRSCGTLPVTDDISDRLLRLPVYYEMNEDNIHRVTDEIKKFYSYTD